MKKEIKNSFVKFLKKWANSESPGILEITICAFILTIAYFLYCGSDVNLTANHGLAFLDSVFTGKLGEFYSIANSYFDSLVVYDLPIYIIFGVWMIPVYFIKNILNINIYDINFHFRTPIIMWIKLLNIVFLVLSIIVIIKICKKIGFSINKIKWLIFFTLSATIVALPIFVLAQYDIISVFFILLGIYYFINNDSKNLFYFLL